MVSNDIMMAVLAMDTYNRKLNPKLDLQYESNNIGTYVRDNTPNTDYQESIGLSYDIYNDGYNKVISYRGTDLNFDGFSYLAMKAIYNQFAQDVNILANLTVDGAGEILNDISMQQYHPFVQDLLNGYGLGLGWGATPQAVEALKIYLSATNSTSVSTPSNYGVTVTGQSLGGGIAGYVSYLTGAEAVLFENMPFRAAANAYLEAGHHLGLLSQQTLGQRYSQSAAIRTYAVATEFLTAARLLSDDPLAYAAGAAPTVEYTNMTGYTGPMDTHGQAMMIIHMFMNPGGTFRTTAWKDAAFDVFSHISDEDVVNFVNVTMGGLGHKDEKMTSMIAYSVIDVGTSVFGDVAIRAITDDIDNLEQISNTIPQSSGIYDELNKLIVTFGADMANRRVHMSASVPGGSPESLKGAIDVNQWTFGISLDFSVERWTREVDPLNVPGAGSIISIMIDQITDGDSTSFENAINHVMGSLGVTSLYDRYDKYTLMYEPQYAVWMTAPPSAGVSMAVSVSSGDDKISGYIAYVGSYLQYGNEVIFGGGGNDTINGNGGNDVLIGGDGNDIIEGGDRSDALMGGSGDDTLIIGGSFAWELHDANGSVVAENDIWDGGAGIDTLSAAGSGYVGIIVNLSSDEVAVRRLFRDANNLVSSENVQIAANHATIGFVSGDVSGIERVIGTNRMDVFVGNGSSYFEGVYDDDVFYVKSGDVARGGNGKDVFYITGSADVQGGNDADEYHFLLSSGWQSVDIHITDLQGIDKVYLDWDGNSILLDQGLPTISYNQEAPAFTLTRSGNDVIQTSIVENAVKTVRYGSNGITTILVEGQSLFGFTYYGHYFQLGNGHNYSIPGAVGDDYYAMRTAMDGMSAVNPVNTALHSGFAIGSGYSDLVLDRVGYPLGQTMGLGTMPNSLVVASHLSESGYYVGPMDANGLAPVFFELNVSGSNVGTFLFGPSGMFNPSYSTIASGERLVGGSGNDFLMAGTGLGSHVLEGGGGKDVLYGRIGSETMYGGGDDDIFLPGYGNDMMDGGDGRDMVSYYDSTQGIHVNVSSGSGSISGPSVGYDAVANMEVVVGTQFSDVFTGGSGGVITDAMIFVGSGGGDVFNLSNGAVAVGGSGVDRFYIADGANVMLLGVGTEDEIYVDGIKVVGSSFDVTYEMTNVTDTGSYDVVEHMVMNGSHMNGYGDTVIGHWDGITGIFSETSSILGGDIIGDSHLYVGSGGAKLSIDHTNVFIGDYVNGTAGLSFEMLTSRTGSAYEGGTSFNMGEVSTSINYYYWYSSYGSHSPMLETTNQIQDLFGLL